MLAHPVNEEHTRRIGEGAFLDCFIHARHVGFPDDLEGIIGDGLILVRKPCQGKTQNDEGKPLFHEHCIPPFILHSDPYRALDDESSGWRGPEAGDVVGDDREDRIGDESEIVQHHQTFCGEPKAPILVVFFQNASSEARGGK